MTAVDSLIMLRRRWYVLTLVALVSMCAISAVHKRAISYEGCSYVYISAPQLSRTSNSYTNNSSSLAMTTSMVTQTMMSQGMQQKFREEGLTAGYEVTQSNTGSIAFPSYTAPTLQICCSSTSPKLVLRTTAVVAETLSIVVYDMQAKLHVPSKSFIRARVLAKTIPSPILGRPLQAYLGVILIGLVGGVALTAWSDSLLGRKSPLEA